MDACLEVGRLLEELLWLGGNVFEVEAMLCEGRNGNCSISVYSYYSWVVCLILPDKIEEKLILTGIVVRSPTPIYAKYIQNPSRFSLHNRKDAPLRRGGPVAQDEQYSLSNRSLGGNCKEQFCS